MAQLPLITILTIKKHFNYYEILSCVNGSGYKYKITENGNVWLLFNII